MIQGIVSRHDTGLLGGTEHLLKVQALALIGDVEHPIRLKVPHTLDHGSQVRGGVDGRAIGLDQNTGRDLLLVAVLLYRDHPCALGLNRNAPVLHILHHGGNVGISITFAQPCLKMHIQVIVDLPHIR